MNAIFQPEGIIGGVVAIVAFLALIALLRAFIRVCPSNHILVVTGGTQTVVEGKEYGFRLQKRWLDDRDSIYPERAVDRSHDTPNQCTG